jgi:hypothetical protein
MIIVDELRLNGRTEECFTFRREIDSSEAMTRYQVEQLYEADNYTDLDRSVEFEQKTLIFFDSPCPEGYSDQSQRFRQSSVPQPMQQAR